MQLPRAVALGGSGTIYIGVNLEFPGTPLNNSVGIAAMACCQASRTEELPSQDVDMSRCMSQVHAEQFLLSNAAWHGETDLKLLAVSAAPCGHCRQFYSELACAVRVQNSKSSDCRDARLNTPLCRAARPADTMLRCLAKCRLVRQCTNYMIACQAMLACQAMHQLYDGHASEYLQDTIHISFGSPPTAYSLAQLLPQRFGPADLLNTADAPLLLLPQRHNLALAEPLGEVFQVEKPLICEAANAAVWAANKVRAWVSTGVLHAVRWLQIVT